MQGSAPQTRQTRKRKRESAATGGEVEVETHGPVTMCVRVYVYLVLYTSTVPYTAFIYLTAVAVGLSGCGQLGQASEPHV